MAIDLMSLTNTVSESVQNLDVINGQAVTPATVRPEGISDETWAAYLATKVENDNLKQLDRATKPGCFGHFPAKS